MAVDWDAYLAEATTVPQAQTRLTRALHLGAFGYK